MDRKKFLPKADRVDRVAFCESLARGKRVLHIGMGGMVDNSEFTRTRLASSVANTLHARLAAVSSDLLGVDINPEAIAIMQKAVPGRYHVADISGQMDLDETFDVVLFPEVIEHLDCFRAALQNIRGLLAPGGIMVLTTANAYAAERLLKMLMRYEAVHDEHTCYFSYMTVKRLMSINGFEMVSFAFATQPRYRFISIYERVIYKIHMMICRIMPQFSDGIVVIAKPV